MKKDQFLEMVNDVAGSIDRDTIFIMGSQSLWVDNDNVPQVVETSIETDFYIGDDPDTIFDIESKYGLHSEYKNEKSVYAHPISEEYEPKCKDWKERTISLSKNNGKDIRCLAPEDLMLCKLYSGRNKDFICVEEMAEMKIVDLNKAEKLIDERLPGRLANTAKSSLGFCKENFQMVKTLIKEVGIDKAKQFMAEFRQSLNSNFKSMNY
jgi:hypothetical protein